MLVTIRLKDKDTLLCDGLDNFTFKPNEEKQEIEVYKNNEFQGYYCSILGITEDEFIKYIQDRQIEII